MTFAPPPPPAPPPRYSMALKRHCHARFKKKKHPPPTPNLPIFPHNGVEFRITSEQRLQFGMQQPWEIYQGINSSHAQTAEFNVASFPLCCHNHELEIHVCALQLL